MRKFVFSIAVLLLQSCGSGKDISSLEQWMQNNGKIKVLSTTAMIDDLVARIGGDKIDHLCLIVGEIDPHSYELVKGDDEKFERADLLFHNGLCLEHGASLHHRIEKHSSAVAVGDKIQKLHPGKILWRKSQVDPHIWMDVELWSEAIPIIEVELSKRLPNEAEYFHKRAEVLKEECLLVHRTIKERLRKIPEEKRYLVTSHDAFDYFTRAYLREEGEMTWQHRFTAPEGLAPEGQISPADIQAVIDHLLQHQIHALFPESNVSRDALKKIAEACASKGFHVKIIKTPLHGDAMGPKGSTADGYLPMMLHNADVLVSAWEGQDE
jgi:manganese/zinc/iron transport system substrate-binding protein